MRRPAKGRLAGIVAVSVFIALALLPFALQAKTTPPWVHATQKISPVAIIAQPTALHNVSLSVVATPVNPDLAPPKPQVADGAHMANLVAAEDLRLRTLLHHVGRLTYPVVMPVASGRPTLVLPGPATYGIADLETAGAVVPLRDGSGYSLIDSVLVASGASLKLGGGTFKTLLMDSSSSGFTSLVTWGGTLVLAGTSSAAPLTIIGWDGTTNKPAVDGAYGRPYIRAVGGRLDLTNVHISSLGFWSGRTGGVAWTGISSRLSTGSAVASTFVGNAYGAFAARADQLQFTGDLFEGNEFDGLRLHRGTTHATVTGSASARNGGNGFVVSRGATDNVLAGDVAIHNGGNGFLINGQSIIGGGPAGSQGIVSVGTVIRDSEAKDNGRTGILVEGGAGTIIQRNIVYSAITGIAVRVGATDTWLVGNEIRSGGRIALEIGPAVTGTTVLQNMVNDARIGLLVRNSPGVRIMGNRFSAMSLFGISVRGTSVGVVGSDNVIAGRGFQPIDARGGADTPAMVNTDTSLWQHRSTLTLVAYLRYHPIMTTWIAILVVVAISAIIVKFRRRAARPYIYSMPWNLAGSPVGGGSIPMEPVVPMVAVQPSARAVRRREPVAAISAYAPQPVAVAATRRPQPVVAAAAEPVAAARTQRVQPVAPVATPRPQPVAAVPVPRPQSVAPVATPRPQPAASVPTPRPQPVAPVPAPRPQPVAAVPVIAPRPPSVVPAPPAIAAQVTAAPAQLRAAVPFIWRPSMQVPPEPAESVANGGAAKARRSPSTEKESAPATAQPRKRKTPASKADTTESSASGNGSEAAAPSQPEPSPFWNWLADGAWTKHDPLAEMAVPERRLPV